MMTNIYEMTAIGDMAPLLCMAVSIVIGVIFSAVYLKTGKCTKNFAVTLALMPALVQIVILMVNGNLGTSVAVLGTFSLIRFRSAQGTSREITSVFFTMAAGLATGMGYLFFAGIITVVISTALILLSVTSFGEKKSGEKILKITIPESLDYEEVFDEVLTAYTKKYELVRIRTTNMGSMFELTYDVVMKEQGKDKKFIDDIRCRNGNLTVVLGHIKPEREEL